MLKVKNIIIIGIGVICCIALIIFYATAYPSHLLWQEQNQIFLNTSHWVATYFDKPAWLGCLAGDWLTQFYHNTTVGAVILTLSIAYCVAVFAVAIKRLLRKPANTLASSPPPHATSSQVKTSEAFATTSIWGQVAAWVLTAIFTVYLIGCSLSSVTSLSFFLCIVGGLTLGLMPLHLPISKDRSINLSPLLVALSYWVFGFGSLLTAFLIILFSLKDIYTYKFTHTSLSSASSSSTSTSLSSLSSTFSSFTGFSKSNCSKHSWITAICAVVLAFGFPALLCDSYALPYGKALLYPGLATPTMPQTKYEKRLAIADAFYHHDYPLAKQLALKVDSPDDVTAFYYYLSSTVQDSLPDNLLKYPVKTLGTLTTISDTTPLMVINMMNDLYFELGDMTYAERAAMMRNVFSPRNRNVRMIQRLAEINLVSGDTLAALKYLRILDNTHAYSDWSHTHTPGKMTPEVETELLNRRAKSNSKDNIRLGDNCRNILLELLESNPNNTVALDYLLCTDLLLKDMDTFKMDYDTYCMQKGTPRYKDLYQQALMIYLAGTDAPQEEWEKYIVSAPLVELFNRYNNHRGDRAFNGTYWYYFDKQ